MSHSIAMNAGCEELDGPAATLLMPLWARAQEAMATDAILHDQAAVRIVNALEFDFGTFVRQRVPTVDYCLRASIIDQLVGQFLTQQPAATVVEFGVGLDARFERLDNGQVRWTEVDLPEVIRLRKKFFSEGPRRKLISGSLLGDEWLDAMPRAAGEPILFVAEGVFYFLTTVEVRQLFARLADRFPGSKLIFDAQSPLFLRISNVRHPLRSSRLTFSLGSEGAEISSWDSRFRVEKYVGFGDSPYYDRARRRLSLVKRLAISIPAVTRHMFKIVQVGFGS